MKPVYLGAFGAIDWDADAWWLIPSLITIALAVLVVFRYAILVRFPLWLLRHTFYRLSVYGADQVPSTGPVLFVSNHVSWLDALLIVAAQRRKVRFLIWAPFLGVPFFRWILRMLRVIPIDGAAGPRAIIHALRTASEALGRGEAVCIFAEGGITRTGFLLPFQRGFEQIVKRQPAPIIPVCLDHVWGSIFSYRGGRFFWKWPKRIPYRVYVNFGAPLPPTVNTFTVYQTIQKLSADSAIRRAPQRRAVHRQFVRLAARHPFRPCLIDPNSPKPILKYGEVLVRVKLLNKRLKPLLGDNPMVGIWLPPSAGGAIANMCVAFLGKTSVNLNYTATSSIIQSAIRQCNIRHVLTSKLFTHKLPLDPGPGVELIYLEDFRKEITTWERIRSMLAVLLVPGWLQERLLGLRRQGGDDLATIIFSSGSTGDPKGVMLTHANVAANCESVIQAIDPTQHDRLLGILPFFHSFGYTVTLWLPLQVGASIIYHPNPLQAREIGELSKKYQATIFLSTPTFLRSYIKRCDAGDYATVRILVCGAEKLPLAVAKEFYEKFKVKPLEGYGCTELSPVACVNVPDWQQGNQRQVGHKPGTIGQPVPGVAARIVHRETGKPLPPNEEGSLQIFGANVMKGYLDRDDLTAKKIIDGGWYITGDLAMMDEEGFVTITGREERFAKVGGEMVPLEKVEEELHTVLESSERILAVTAIPDGKKGERLIVLHLPLTVAVPEVWKRLSDRGLPNLYVPGQRDFFQVAELPILGSGKLDLRKCKEKALEVAGAGE
jgi:acyl-[acyl-carrier-protein]-phospholipid O-acyltransferase/long-chain-fatty-acid--[acyl-carrier-protein] ligase